MKLHFISGLPRSGGTLLSSLLQQNPAFCARELSPMYYTICDMEKSLSPYNDTSVEVTSSNRIDILTGIFESYYKYDKYLTVFDHSQYWSQKQALIMTELFPTSVMICVVRDLVEILNSFEHLYQQNPLHLSKYHGYDPHTTVVGRAAFLCSREGPVGKAWDGLSELYYSGQPDNRVLFIEYNDLVVNWNKQIQRIHDAIGYSPDFTYCENIDSYLSLESSYSEVVNMPTLMKVRPTVKAIPRKLILPPDLVKQYSGKEFWRHPSEATAAKDSQLVN